MALHAASLELETGESHALLGENGAGKSTLVRVLYGLVDPDRGESRSGDQPVSIQSPRHALALGIGLVHQLELGREVRRRGPALVVRKPLARAGEAEVIRASAAIW